ncbi:MAG TPA: PAS domain S-box protein [Myxococcales bacterium]
MFQTLRSRRRAEHALRESERRYRTLFETASDAILVLHDDRIVDCNAGASRLFGRSREELLGRRIFGLAPERQGDGRPSRALALERMGAALAGQPQIYEFAYRRPAGASFECEVHLNALVLDSGTLLLAVVRDVSERKRVEEALRRSEQKFAKVFTAAPDVIAIVRLADGVFLDVNPAFEETFGYTRAGATGRTSQQMGLWADRQQRERVIEQLQTSGEARSAEAMFFHRDGSPRDGLISARLIEIGGERCILWLFKDITERKRMEEALREASRRKDEFLAMLSHELRNPLAPIRNAAHLLHLLLPEEPRVQRAREIIERQLAHISRLLDDLLDVARITTGTLPLRRERFDLREAASFAVEGARPKLMGRECDLSYQDPKRPIWVEGDRVRLAQLVGNLLDNACKFSARGQHIELSLDVVGNGGGPQARVRVRDEGQGIAPELLPHVFELFVQADRSLARSQGGLGIGLTLVQRIAAAHGGHVEVHSAGPGKGSEFSVVLPAVEEAAARPTGGRERRATAAPSRILVVDDNADEAQSLRDLVGFWGHEVQTAPDGPAALALAAAFRPRVVLLDLGLPRMDGYEVARRLRSLFPGTAPRLLAVSGYGSEEDRRRSHEAGIERHLTKPVDPAELERALEGPARAGG